MAESGFDSLSHAVRDIFMAGVGLAATGVDKSKEVIDDLVEKGKLTVEQGRELNSELSRKAKDKADSTISDAQDRLLRMRMAAMNDDERKEYVARVSRIAEKLNGGSPDDTGDASGIHAPGDTGQEGSPDPSEKNG